MERLLTAWRIRPRPPPHSDQQPIDLAHVLLVSPEDPWDLVPAALNDRVVHMHVVRVGEHGHRELQRSEDMQVKVRLRNGASVIFVERTGDRPAGT